VVGLDTTESASYVLVSSEVTFDQREDAFDRVVPRRIRRYVPQVDIIHATKLSYAWYIIDKVKSI
jgi:hypothetical protein